MKFKSFIKIALIVTVVAVLGLFVRLDYFLISPSRAVDLRDLISIEDTSAGERGGIFLLTVTQQRASPLTAVYALVHPHVDLNPMERVIPRDMTEEEYRELLAENMIESQHLAQVVALRRAGYDVDIISDGVEVIALFEDAPAEGFLQENDKIIFVDGAPVFLATEVPLLVQDRAVGEEVAITLVRDGREIEINVPTGESPDDDQMPFLGIFIKTMPWEPLIPVEVEMNTGRIGGPSAGLMFVLEIMNQVTAEDITGGRDITGTGTIDLNENIGRIGGVTQKVIAAEKSGLEYFFIPLSNYEEAKRVARQVEVIPVSNLEEVLEFLADLESR